MPTLSQTNLNPSGAGVRAPYKLIHSWFRFQVCPLLCAQTAALHLWLVTGHPPPRQPTHQTARTEFGIE